jgi:hypothetical protein
MENSTEFAVVINGHSLVHALHPQLEQLFLEVSSQCKWIRLIDLKALIHLNYFTT